MADEQLEPLGEAGILGGALGQGGHIHRVHGDKGGLDQLLLHLLVEALVQGVAPGLFRRLGQLHANGLGGRHGLLVGGDGHKVDAAVLLHRLVHGQAGPAGGQIQLLTLPLQLIGAQQLLGGGGEQILKQVHHIVEIGIGLIQLDGGELRVVLGVHTLVAEDAADLIHPVHAAHNEPLQGQLSGDAHIHIDIQGIVVGDEGAGGGAAGDGVENGGLHLHKAPVVHELPDVLDKLGADDKVPLHLGIDNQVHIPLAVAQLRVGQAVELLRQGQQGLAQQGHPLHPDGHLAPLGAEHHALDAYDVANVKLLESGVLRLVHLIPAGIQLDAPGLVLQIAEGHLTHAPLGHEPPGHGHSLPLQGVKIRLDVGAVVVHLIPGDLEGVVPALLKLLQLIPSDLEQLRQVLLLGDLLILLVGHCFHSYLSSGDGRF